MTVHVLWNVLDEMPHLPRHVDDAEHAIGGAVRHVFVDGRYPEFPGDETLSTDGTAGFCRDAGSYVPLAADEVSKRTTGLREIDLNAVAGDHVVVLDGDEELQWFFRPEGFGLLFFRRDSDDAPYLRARVYPWKAGYEFRGRHFTLYDGDEMVASLTEAKNDMICGGGRHHNTIHPLPRARAKKDYYSWLTRHEWDMAR